MCTRTVHVPPQVILYTDDYLSSMRTMAHRSHRWKSILWSTRTTCETNKSRVLYRV